MPTLNERTHLLRHDDLLSPLGIKAAPLAGDCNSAPLGPLDISDKTRHGVLAGIWLATFLSALNLTLVPTMITSISSDFNKSNQASWLGTSYLLATTTFTPLYGRLCDVMGRRAATQLAILFAGAGTLACGLSESMESLIAARFLSGLGGGGIFTTSLIVTSDMYDIRSRGFVQSLAGVLFGLGMGLGGPVGGVATDFLGWRWAFLMQIPLFIICFTIITYNLCYTMPGSGRSTREVLSRVDYLGSAALFGAVGSFLVFLSVRYNDDQPWSDPTVRISLLLACIFVTLFILVEFFVAVEPVMVPSLLMQKTPLLVGLSNLLVALNNLSITYFFPIWFQTVMMTSASEAGLHLLPNSLCLSTGSLFAGWMMKTTGRYRKMNLILGFFPIIALFLLIIMGEDASPIQSWMSIMPLGFGNAVVLQTMYIALVAHLPESEMAVGTGFSQLFRGLGQVSGLAISSAVFQSVLTSELRRRIRGPGAEDTIRVVRQSARIIRVLPSDLQRAVRDSYSTSVKAVFFVSATAAVLAYIVRWPIPDKELRDGSPAGESVGDIRHAGNYGSSSSSSSSSIMEEVDEEVKGPVSRRKHAV